MLVLRLTSGFPVVRRQGQQKQALTYIWGQMVCHPFSKKLTHFIVPILLHPSVCLQLSHVSCYYCVLTWRRYCLKRASSPEKKEVAKLVSKSEACGPSTFSLQPRRLRLSHHRHQPRHCRRHHHHYEKHFFGDWIMILRTIEDNWR